MDKNKTYNSEDSLVVTHPTTNSPACGLSTAERTGSPVLHTLWSYVCDSKVSRNIFQIQKVNPCVRHGRAVQGFASRPVPPSLTVDIGTLEVGIVGTWHSSFVVATCGR
ncbi:hypothetical protein ACN38_g8169 [Penicillium nordicum]|uniref:Uncharacterized protein n=2 Tax=Penicillium TaxID=5073 RepID=A0A0M8P0D7_9EURO|nr:hypothetical protein ACN38_g8169 [Penicillium nordicum]